jgi:HAD superfamily hydrolase (TIGR01509 family)
LPGVKSTLTQLHQSGFVLGAVADCEYPAATVSEHFGRFAIGRLFATVVSSIDLGRTMPNAACYLSALRGMGLSPAEVAFVGHDTLQLDGAAAVGMSTIALNYDADAEADIFLSRFDELPDVLPARDVRAAAG